MPAATLPAHLRPRVARARAYAPGRHEPNKTELRYGEHLEGLRTAGVVVWFKFEPFVLDVTLYARMVTYKPDYLVQLPNGELEIHEVKGTKNTQAGRKLVWKEDARIKFRACADQYPIWRFLAFGWVPGTRTMQGRWMKDREQYGPKDSHDGKTTSEG